MTAPNTGCIDSGRLSSGVHITVTGGNANQHADGIEMFLVEVIDDQGKFKEEPRVITKRNMNSDEVSLLIEHHYRNRFKRVRR